MKTLVAGWFSFEGGHATAGDLITRDLVCEWLQAAGHPYHVAVAPPFTGGVDWRTADPGDYTHVVFVCGPFGREAWEKEFVSRFEACRLIGMNLSMKVPLDEWNPFDLLIERDSSGGANPDISFLSRQALVPVVGVCRVEDYEGAPVALANLAIDRLIQSRQISIVEIDTRLDQNSTGLRTPAEVEALLARMDVVITTRLHGTVLSLKNGVPVIAIDPEVRGWKIRRQAELIGWPVIFNVDDLPDEALQGALDFCLTEAARIQARDCRERAKQLAAEVQRGFFAALATGGAIEAAYQTRLSRAPGQVANGKPGRPEPDHARSEAGRFSPHRGRLAILLGQAKGWLKSVGRWT
jgi:Polysaccharide pyruvyl transferase